MNKKTISIITIITITLIIMGKIVYATNFTEKSNQKDEFFTVDKTEVAQNGYVTMTIDFSKVDYESFKFTLTSNATIAGNVLKQDDTENKNDYKNNISISSNNSENTITIQGEKSNLETEKIELYYKIPSTIAIGSKITLNAKIENTSSANDNANSNNNIEQNQIEINNTISNGSINQITNQTETDNNVPNNYKETNIELTVVEKENPSADTNNNTINEPNIDNMHTIEDSSNNIYQQTNDIKTSTINSQGTLKVSSSITDSSTTYLGSGNNYLTNIEIEGYKLTPEFSMTNTTYFLNVDNDTTSINISTTKYDSTETVKIYGNTDLKTGENKVLISVTAQNGNVKTYRIYVTRN